MGRKCCLDRNYFSPAGRLAVGFELGRRRQIRAAGKGNARTTSGCGTGILSLTLTAVLDNTLTDDGTHVPATGPTQAPGTARLLSRISRI